MFYSIEECMKMIIEYEKIRGVNYDVIISSRFDVMDYVTFDSQSIFEASQMNKNGTKAVFMASYHGKHLSMRRAEDRFFLGTRHGMINLKNLYKQYPHVSHESAQELGIVIKKSESPDLLNQEWIFTRFFQQNDVTILPKKCNIGPYDKHSFLHGMDE